MSTTTTTTTTTSNPQPTAAVMVPLDECTGSLPECALWRRNCSDLYGRTVGTFERRGLTLRDTLDNAGLGVRFFCRYYLRERLLRGNTTTFDPLHQNVGHPNEMGMPLGGMGAGTVTRSFTGQTARLSGWVKPGVHSTLHRPLDHFSLRTVRVPARVAETKEEQSEEEEEEEQGMVAAMVLNTATAQHTQSERQQSCPWDEWHMWGGEMGAMKPTASAGADAGAGAGAGADVRETTRLLMGDTTATYYALFPAAHYVYHQERNGLRMVCRQFSPVVAHNYRESSLPVALFEWELHNTDGRSDIEVSLMQSMQNGGYMDPGDRHYWEVREGRRVLLLGHGDNGGSGGSGDNGGSGGDMLAMRSTWHCRGHRDTVTVVLAAEAVETDQHRHKQGEEEEGALTTVCRFDPQCRDSCTAVWRSFVRTGTLLTSSSSSSSSNDDDDDDDGHDRHGAGAICVKVRVGAGQRRRVRFAMVWHHPVVTMGDGSSSSSSSGSGRTRRYRRRYTRFFSDPLALARTALQSSDHWYEQVLRWQRSVLLDMADPSGGARQGGAAAAAQSGTTLLPLWVRGHMLNELYYMVDGGTIWVHDEEADSSGEESEDDTATSSSSSMGRFVYQESHEYIMANTYDVHFYAGHAFLVHFPRIQLAIQRDYVRTVQMSHPERVCWFGTGTTSQRKRPGCLPHDVGTVDEDLWHRVNSYQIQDTNRWKDLNCMFVLSVLRDYTATRDVAFLRHCYPSVVQVLRYHERFDTDGDGVIENESFPDSTYDVWTVVGVSAFSGGLYIAANRAAAEMARLLGDTEAHARYMELAVRGARSYEAKLWNGRYYNYDSSDSAHHTTIQSDMLHGHWMLRLCGLPALLDKDRVASALRTIHEFNVRRFAREANSGRPFGCVNGMRPDGKVDRRFVQSREVWTGVSYTTAALMLLEGMTDEALEIVQGVKEACWETLGFWWQTPEAYHTNGDYRALGYMRPLSIWAVWLALQRRQQEMKDGAQ